MPDMTSFNMSYASIIGMSYVFTSCTSCVSTCCMCHVPIADKSYVPTVITSYVSKAHFVPIVVGMSYMSMYRMSYVSIPSMAMRLS